MSSKTAEEIRGLGLIKADQRDWWDSGPLLILIALIISAVTIGVNFAVLHNGQNNLFALTSQIKANNQQNHRLAVENQRLARVAAQVAYHDCVVTKAIVLWTNDLGPLEKGSSLPADRVYHKKRYVAFQKLHNTLYRIDGIPCVPMVARKLLEQVTTTKEDY